MSQRITVLFVFIFFFLVAIVWLLCLPLTVFLLLEIVVNYCKSFQKPMLSLELPVMAQIQNTNFLVKIRHASKGIVQHFWKYSPCPSPHNKHVSIYQMVHEYMLPLEDQTVFFF